eukprot:gnl/TRDRNA2_/TRDRNA2_65959_c0_seq2.p1 gnl/TRDRNA2_/TRDRNA2_65959_c0~~gnl/TRDRNA2_/TRDRNA2_65959_c0_seq2.p1  ORF type:complete len:381 (-),score=63.08 gnl/TRDRNA2_/TRDRNA2_65959_c0_seq2:471-1613(-)
MATVTQSMLLGIGIEKASDNLRSKDPLEKECPGECKHSKADNQEEAVQEWDRGRSSTQGNGIGSLPDDSNLSNAIQDAFDKQGVSSELMEDYATREQKCLRLSQRSSAESLSQQVREIALRFMQHLVQLMNLPHSSWFDAVALLDTYQPPVERLPAACVALVKILKKNDCATCSMRSANFSVHASHMAHWLHQCGHTTSSSDVSEEDIRLEERRVLKELEWQIKIPTPESWSSIYCARFNILTRNTLVSSVEWIWQQSLYLGRMILTREALTGDLPPRRAAQGLLCLGLVGARLLPLDVLRPEKVDSAEFEELFAKVQPHGAVPTCALTSGHWQCLVDWLKVATGATIPELQVDAERVARIMAEAIVDIQAHQKVHHTSL